MSKNDQPNLLEDPSAVATSSEQKLIEEAIDALNFTPISKEIIEPEFIDFSDEPVAQSTPGDKWKELWDGKDPLQAIDITGVKQSGIPDCQFMSTLASLANTTQGKILIRDMITVNSDGSYTVRFPGDKDTPITITREQIENGKSNKNQSMWARVIETAYVEYVKSTPLLGAVRRDDLPILGRAPTATKIMELLTGAPAASDLTTGVSVGGGVIGIGATSIENVGRDLEEAMKNGLVVTAGIDPTMVAKIEGANPFRDPDPLVDQHQYSVIGYDPVTKTVKVRNPWGHMGGPLEQAGATVDGITHVGDGVLTMSLETFYKNFNDVHFSNTNPNVHNAVNVLETIRDRNDNVLAAMIATVTGDLPGALKAIKQSNVDAVYVLRELLYLGSQGSASQLVDNPFHTLALANPALLPVADLLDEFFDKNGGKLLNELAAGGDAALHAVLGQLAKLKQPVSSIWSKFSNALQEAVNSIP